MKKAISVLVLASVFLISGCALSGGSEKTNIKIKSAEYKDQSLVVRLDSNQGTNNTRVEIVDSKGNILCTKYIELKEGLNVKSFEECPIKNNITISVSSPSGKLKTKDFDLGLPLFELKEGMKYKYSGGLSLYLTNETNDTWEGIMTYRFSDFEGKKARVFRFKLYKKNLSLMLSYSLGLDEANEVGLRYLTIDRYRDVYIFSDIPVPYLFPLSYFKGRGDLNVDNLIETGVASYSPVFGGIVEAKLSREKSHSGWLTRKLDISGKKETYIEAYTSSEPPYALVDVVDGDTSLFTLSEVKREDFDKSQLEGYSVKSHPEKNFSVGATCIEELGGDYTAEISITNLGRERIFIDEIEIEKLSGGPVNMTKDISFLEPKEFIESESNYDRFEDNGCNGDGCRYNITWSGMTKQVCVCGSCPDYDYSK